MCYYVLESQLVGLIDGLRQFDDCLPVCHQKTRLRGFLKPLVVFFKIHFQKFSL